MNLTRIIRIKEKIAVGEPLQPDERDFVLECINEAVRPVERSMTGAAKHEAPNYLGRIEAIYMALSLDEGGEGVCAAPLGDSGITAALVAADKRRFDSYMLPMARHVAKMFGKPVRIAKFTKREDIDILQP
jgi:hypothetical protein